MKSNILLVEDDHSVGYLLTEYLKMKGYNVTWVQNGVEGLATLTTGSFDLAIVDVMMPELDSFGFAKKLREQGLQLPYMHDGRFATLEAVVDFYSEGLQSSANIDPLMKHADRGGVHLNEEEKSALVAFLYTLTDSSFVAEEKPSVIPFWKVGVPAGERGAFP